MAMSIDAPDDAAVGVSRSLPEPSGRNRGRHPRVRRVVALSIGYVVMIGFMALAAYRSRFDLDNIDGISYISIARQYADGHGDTAVNAYWSPLISWLMAPLLRAGIPEIPAFHTVSIVGMAIGIGLGTRLVWRCTSHNVWASWLFLGTTGVFAAGNIRVLTPDMLVVAWVLCFVVVLVRLTRRMSDGTSTHRDGALVGVVCALGYFAKFFLLPVMFVSVAVWLLVVSVWRRSNSGSSLVGAARLPLTRLAVALVVGGLLAAPWVGALSVKYGYVTAGSSFTVNMASKTGPVADVGAEGGVPVLWEPPNQRAVSFGEDRTFQVATGGGTGSGGSVVSAGRYYLSERVAAFPHYLQRIASIAPLAVALFAAFCVAAVFGALDLRRHVAASTAFLVWVVYFLGYAGVTTAATAGGNTRYYWPLLVLSMLGASLLLPPLLRRLAQSTSLTRRVLGALILATLPVSVIWQHGLGRAEPFSLGPPPPGWGQMFVPAERPEPEVFVEDALAEIIPSGSKIVGSNYRATLRYAYYLEAQVYGRAEQGYDAADPDFQSVLRHSGIDYYLLFTPVGQEPLSLARLGPAVASFERLWTCSDRKGAQIEQCRIDVIRVAY